MYKCALCDTKVTCRLQLEHHGGGTNRDTGDLEARHMPNIKRRISYNVIVFKKD